MAKLLLIEDDAATRLLVREALEAAGMELLEASDGQVGARPRSDYVEPDPILLDVGLPVLDGLQAARGLLEGGVTHGIPLVFLSARTAHDDRERGLRLGARDYITKPFDPTRLAERVKRILADARGARADHPLMPPSLSTV